MRSSKVEEIEKVRDLPDDFPDFLRHEEEDAPVPSWEQVTRSLDSVNKEMIARVSRIVAGADTEQEARVVWDRWPTQYRRSMGLLIDKIYHEGWLECVDTATGVWDGGMFFRPKDSLVELLDSKAEYTRASLRNGLAAWLNRWNHKSWVMSWMENDADRAALHVGVFADGTAEAHLDLFNPLFTRGAPRRDLFSLPLIGSFNHRLFRMHYRWERPPYAQIARRSENLYHIMRESVTLSF